MFDPKSVRFRGPLACHVEGFWGELMRQGYAPLSGRNLLLVAAHVSRWLDDRGLVASDLTSERVAQFAKHRRRLGYTQFLTPRAVEPLLSYLFKVGATPPAAPPADMPIDGFVREYGSYLATERGLVVTTIRQHTDFARRFIDAQFGTKVLDWHALGAADVTAFVSRDFQGSSVACKRMVPQLRSLLRYLHAQGLAYDLSGCVPAVAGWRLASLPKGLEPEQVAQMLAACDPSSLAGARDRAILCLMARLGLRAGEVSALRLADVDWQAGEMVVRGKPRRESRLPLPPDVGKAIVAYLRQRPRVANRAVFLCLRAPHRPITTSAISALTRRQLRALGVSSGSAHVLRHTAATQMLRRGVSLADIGHVLRHRHVDTTAIYAKVHHSVLRTLAQPWPGGVT